MPYSCRRENHELLKGFFQRLQIMGLVIIDPGFFNINNENHSHEITMKLKGKIVIAIHDFSE